MTSPQTLHSILDSLDEHGAKTAMVVFGKKDREHWGSSWGRILIFDIWLSGARGKQRLRSCIVRRRVR